jgi:hypothetical protein
MWAQSFQNHNFGFKDNQNTFVLKSFFFFFHNHLSQYYVKEKKKRSELLLSDASATYFMQMCHSPLVIMTYAALQYGSIFICILWCCVVFCI